MKTKQKTVKADKASAQERVPKLRFPEFLSAGAWKIDAFDKFVEVIDGDRGKNYPKADEFSNSGYCVFLNAKNVTKNGFKFEVIQFIEKEKDEALRKGKLQRLDVVLTTRGSVGHFAFYSEDIPYDNIRINSGMVVLRIKSEKINTDYLYSFSKSEVLSIYIENIAFGNAQQQLTVAEIKKFQLYYPEPDEQQKIADCLSSIDDLIAAQSQKLDTLKAHKKGLMQQLFPAEGETVPKLRFPEFQGKWCCVELGDCFKNTVGTALEKHVSDEGTHHFISIGNYSKDGKYIDKGQRIEVNEVTKIRLLNKNNLVMVLNDKTAAGDIIGATLLIDEDDKYIYNQRSERLVVNSNMRPLFAWFMLNSEMSRKEVFKRSQGGTQIYVNFSSVKAIKTYIPDSPEQQKIADCLSSIDEQITAQAQKLDTLKAHKKGLMQQLFTSADEVTG